MNDRFVLSVPLYNPNNSVPRRHLFLFDMSSNTSAGGSSTTCMPGKSGRSLILIFVFRGPILRCSKGDLRAEVKRVVWHEVAHWLGYETEEQVKALGL